MPQDYTPEQIAKLQSLGIQIDHQFNQTNNQENFDIRILTLDIKPKKNSPIFPLLSISGLTILSFGGLVLLKGKNQATIPQTASPIRSPQDVGGPTQVPKSIQHYLLTSQQLFSQALQLQQQQTASNQKNSELAELLNQSILAATKAIKDFPQDYRGYQQRGRIYQALTNSKPDLINQSISDLVSAQRLNPNSIEINHTLASLYAKKGDVRNTILYLNETVAIDPTQAQNFYDLAKIQQQAGFLSQALDTYNKLTTLLTDPNQKTQVEAEKTALQKIISENPNLKNNSATTPSTPTTNLPSNLDSPTIQALSDGGLIVAAPDDNKNIEVTNQTDSNSLSGNSTLTSGLKSITITNTQVSSTSQVYVTATKGGKNQNLQVLSKSDKSFTVGFDFPLSEDVEFKWWIIN